jgi:DNA-binding NarL/FixJ family response regulator
MSDTHAARRIMAVVPDLFFAAKIAAVAKAAGVTLAFATAADVQARCAEAPPDLVLLDLHAGPEVPDLIRALKAGDATRTVPLLGFHSHVDIETRKAALEAGIDRAMPRSAFVARLSAILAGAETPEPRS